MKILYVTTIQATMSFFAEHFKMLLDAGHTVELVCCRSAEPLKDNIRALMLPIYDIPFSRSPFSKNNLKAYRQLKQIVKNGHYDIVHCHTPIAAMYTRLACRGLRKNGLRVFYTAHGFHFYKGAPLKNWLLYYTVEWVCAHWTDTLITINREDYALAQKHMHAKRVEYVPGVGVNLEKYSRKTADHKAKRAELGLPDNATVLISVGELNANKNHETVVRAISGMDVYYIVAGKGDRKERLEQVAADAGMSDRVKLLGYRTDVSELYKASDLFVFPSFREGLPVSLMEAMATGLPCAVSRIRGNVDLIDEKGGTTFSPHSIEECREAINAAINGDKSKAGMYNADKVKKFESDVVIEQMKTIYGIK